MQKREADVLAALIPSDIRAQLFHLPPELGNELLRAPFPTATTLTLCYTQNATAKSPNTGLAVQKGILRIPTGRTWGSAMRHS